MAINEADLGTIPGHIFIGGGLGDVAAIEAFWSDEFRANLTDIYYGSTREKLIRELIGSCPAYSHVRHHTLYENWNERGAVTYLDEIQDAPAIADWSVSVRFVDVLCRSLTFNPPAFFAHELADLAGIELPERYAVIQGDTPINPAGHRDERMLTAEDWDWIIGELERRDLAGVVLNSPGAAPAPPHERIRDLTGTTSVPESLEILKRASAYLGIDSWLSVYASMLFPGADLAVRSVNPWLHANKSVYYPTHKDWPWLRTHFGVPKPRPDRIHNPMRYVQLKRQWLIGSTVFVAGDVVHLDHDRAFGLVAGGVGVYCEAPAVPAVSKMEGKATLDIGATIERAEKRRGKIR